MDTMDTVSQQKAGIPIQDDDMRNPEKKRTRIRKMLTAMRKSGTPQKSWVFSRRTLIVGTSQLAGKLAAEIGSQRRCSYTVIGVISERNDIEGKFEEARYPLLGALKDLQQIIDEHRPDRIIVALDERIACLHADLLVECEVRNNLKVETGVEAYEKLTGKLAIESLVPGNVIFSSEFRQSAFVLWVARLSSMLAAIIGMVFCLPLMVAIGLSIKYTSLGPVFFIQERVGLGGRNFRLLKFRSMYETTASHSEWARDNSDRITPLGKILRKFRFDELPQFINIIRGDMNLIGPRPHPAVNGELFTLVSRNTPECGDQIPYYSLRSSIRPGITGWAQVRYKYANGLDEEIEKLRYDLYYIKHHTIFMDIRILLETVKIVLLGHESRSEPDQHAKANLETGSNRDVPEGVSIGEEYAEIKGSEISSLNSYGGNPRGSKSLVGQNLQSGL